tara:strand:- start:4448 stop:4915 length:468 start_codon:yes stop_codon:yes gene_type:complete
VKIRAPNAVQGNIQAVGKIAQIVIMASINQIRESRLAQHVEVGNGHQIITRLILDPIDAEEETNTRPEMVLRQRVRPTSAIHAQTTWNKKAQPNHTFVSAKPDIMGLLLQLVMVALSVLQAKCPHKLQVQIIMYVLIVVQLNTARQGQQFVKAVT